VSVWYGLPDGGGLSAATILRGVKGLCVGAGEDTVLWFQHEFGIWGNGLEFANTLRGLDLPKIVTLHTLRFQSEETPLGLCRREHALLHDILPHVDAITVFSEGVYFAVTGAFPHHAGKVHVLRHAVHDYAAIRKMRRQDAKRALHDFLVGDSGLDAETKRALESERILLEPDTVVLGQTGFLHPIKGSEFLFPARDMLQEMIPDRRIAAIRIGNARLNEHQEHVLGLRRQQDLRSKLLLELFLPHNLIPLAQRAFDFNYYWPSDCTQSGMLAHALGAGAVIAGRSLEGVGETLTEAGALCETDQQRLLLRITDAVRYPRLGLELEANAAHYAAGLSWERQARQHYALARHVAPAPLPTEAVGGIGSPRYERVRPS
jgi:hypothetical protein